jgi:hypothetical protein
MKRSYLATTILLLIICFSSQRLLGQAAEQKLSQTILYKDSLFWVAYNTCDHSRYGQFFSDDVEFYHDKGGITNGVTALAEVSKKNLCSNPDFRIRREAIPGTLKVFPMHNADTIYGAIFSGDHLFYITEKGKERLSGKASFTHLWRLQNGEWKMTRVLSYDHGPAPYINKRKEIQLSAKDLNQFVGNFKGDKSGTVKISKDNNLLALTSNYETSILYAEAPDLFFMKERDLTFEFVKDKNNKVHSLVVRENGEVAEKLQKQK